MIRLIRNLRFTLKSPRWRRALWIALISDMLSFALVLIPPVQWGVEAVTAILLLLVLGFRWPLFLALIVETIPAIQVFPSWTLAVLALAATEKEKSNSDQR